MRAQGATEYVAMLAIVTLIGLAAISIVASNFQTAPSIAEYDSLVYWQSQAKPFRILEAAYGSGVSCTGGASEGTTGYRLVMENSDRDSVTLTDVKVNGASSPFCSAGGTAGNEVQFSSLQKKSVYVELSANCSAGAYLDSSISFVYAKGAFSGRAQNGTKNLMLKCTDAAVGNASASAPGAAAHLAISSSSLPAAQAAATYSATLAATGGSGPYSWSIEGLPYGLSYSASSGAISGSPGYWTAGEYSLKVTVTSGLQTASKYLTLAVQDKGALAITTTSLPDGDTFTVYSARLESVGGSSPYTWGIFSGSLPAGLSLGGSGTISGTPAASDGTYPFTVQVTDNSGATATKALSITISTDMAITTAALPDAAIGVAYSATLNSICYYGCRWSISSGSLPPGLNLSDLELNQNDVALIVGTPTTTGTYQFTATITGGYSGEQTNSKTFTINVGTIAITTATLPNGAAGASYSTTFTGAGGSTPYYWEISGGNSSLSAIGISLNPTTGVLSGTPTAAGTYSFSVRMMDNTGESTTKGFSLTINPALTITTSSPLPATTVLRPYNYTFQASGGLTPYCWTMQFLAPGAGFVQGGACSPSFSGAPYSSTPSPAPMVDVTVTGGGSDSGTFDLMINSPPAITTASPLPSGTVGTPYSQTFAVIGGTGAYNWSMGSGGQALADLGLDFSSSGVLSGTPANGGGATLGITATDSVGATATNSFSLTINLIALGASCAGYESYCVSGASCCGTAWCNAGTCCSNDEQPCSSGSTCCSGVCDPNNLEYIGAHCSATCLAEGSYCDEQNSQCCGTCDMAFNTCVGSSRPAGSSCIRSDQCSTGMCFEGQCECYPDGNSCSSTAQCCTGACTERYPGYGTVCFTCYANGVQCGSSTDCCSGVCLAEFCAACVPLGIPSDSDAHCCSGARDFSQLCCLAEGVACTANSECCTGWCYDDGSGGVCIV